MDIGIQGKWALVCGASTGLGYACADALAGEGVNVVIASRTEDAIQASAERLRQRHAVTVIPVAADVATEQGRDRLLQAAPQVDILVNNAGGPPQGGFQDVTHAQWLAALETNMLAPIALIRAVVDDMVARRFGRIVNITSISVKAPVPSLCLSNGARAGLTGFVGGAARQVAHHNVTINNLLPGRFDTDRLKQNIAYRAAQSGAGTDAVTEQMLAAIPAQRLGVPSEFGHACAFLCSAYAGYITGQNLLIDGGDYHGML